MLYPDFNELLELRHKAGVLDLATSRKVSSALVGSYSSTFRGQGLDFEEVREYVPGDDVRNIDWRVTARTGKTHLKVFREERERSVILCIDLGDHMNFGTRGTFKSIQAAQVAALLGWSASSHHDRVGSIVFGNVPKGIQYFPPTRSRQSMWQMLRLLSDKHRYKNPEPVNLEKVLRKLNRASPTGSLIFIIADFYDINKEVERGLSNLKRKCEVVLLPVYDPSDSDFPAVGNVIFANENREKIDLDTDYTKGRDLYKKQWQESQLRFEKITRGLNIHVIPIYTNEDVDFSIVKGLRKIGKKWVVI